MREAIATGNTVQEAYEKACAMLGVETYLAEQEILEMPVKKTLGFFGGNPAKVRAFIRNSPAEKAAEYLKDILKGMGASRVEVTVQPEEGGAMLCVSGEDVGFVIGHRGETLDALQYLAGLIANQESETYFRITLDIGNYRQKRRETLEVLGKKMAAKVMRSRRNCSLEPMNPYERRIIHAAVQDMEGIKSWSEGEGMDRHIVIGPEEGERPFSKKHRRYGKPGGPRKPGANPHKKGGHNARQDLRGESPKESKNGVFPSALGASSLQG